MTPTEELREEHGIIMRMFAILQRMGEMMEKRYSHAEKHLEQIMEFLKVFVDQCHHGKEEEILFPELENAKLPDEGRMVRELISEHLAGREIVEEMGRALEKRKQQADEATSEFVEASNRYVKLFRRHIRKENGMLFPEVNKRLSKDKQVEISMGFQNLEHEKIGEGRHEVFHSLIKALEKIGT